MESRNGKEACWRGRSRSWEQALLGRLCRKGIVGKRRHYRKGDLKEMLWEIAYFGRNDSIGEDSLGIREVRKQHIASSLPEEVFGRRQVEL